MGTLSGCGFMFANTFKNFTLSIGVSPSPKIPPQQTWIPASRTSSSVANLSENVLVDYNHKCIINRRLMHAQFVTISFVAEIATNRMTEASVLQSMNNKALLGMLAAAAVLLNLRVRATRLP